MDFKADDLAKVQWPKFSLWLKQKPVPEGWHPPGSSPAPEIRAPWEGTSPALFMTPDAFLNFVFLVS